jgi:response regulator RpfG family c-di-GMP phosphodiesterase
MDDLDDDDWLIEDDEDGVQPGAGDAPALQRPWRVLVVDDDADVHAVTRLALRNVSFKGRALELFSAYSGADGFRLLRDTADIALVLLDVVMETEDAGLVLARRIREELDNQTVRVVLRTGQPGQAPEQRVIIDYDINDYKAKTELTTQRLFTAVISALRAYETLTMLERSRAGLGRILAGATNLYQAGSLREFASGVLGQVSAVLDVGADGMLCVLAPDGGEPGVLAATGAYAELAGQAQLPAGHPLRPSFERALRERCSLYEPAATVLLIHTQQQQRLCIAVSPPLPMAPIQRDLLELYCQRIAAAFDNQYLFDQLRKTQEATVAMLAEVAGLRNPGALDHARRVRELATSIALRMQERAAGDPAGDPAAGDPELSAQLVAQIGLASMLHDVGMVAAFDPPEPPPSFTPGQRSVMQRHAGIGRQMLERAAATAGGVNFLTFGAQAAGGHHERFDGGGYPDGLKGRAIPLCARIVAAADVFDALVNERAYKHAWTRAEALDYLREQGGRQFDPEVVAALLDVIGRVPGQ